MLTTRIKLKTNRQVLIWHVRHIFCRGMLLTTFMLPVYKLIP